MRSTLALAAASVAVAAGALAAPAGAFTIHCGQTITQNVMVANDVTNCPGTGLVIGADNIVVDLNGHTITGNTNDVSAYGVNLAGHHGVTVRNGFVRNFPTGIWVDGNANTLYRVRTNRDASLPSTPYGETGVWIETASGNRITDSTQSGNDTGIEVDGGSFGLNADGNTIAGDLATGNGTGIQIEGPDDAALANRNAVINSTITGNGTGIILHSAHYTAITDNTLSGNVDGVADVFSHDSTISSNRVTGMGAGTGSGFSFAGPLSTNGSPGSTGPELVQGNQSIKSRYGYDAGAFSRVTFKADRAQLDGVGFYLHGSNSTLINNIAGSVSGLAGGAGGNGTGMRIVHDPVVFWDFTVTLTGNSAHSNRGDGIDIGGGGNHVVSANSANRNGGNGFQLGGGFTSVRDNTARYNGGFGFASTNMGPPSFDQGGNHASFNVLGQCQLPLTCVP